MNTRELEAYRTNVYEAERQAQRACYRVRAARARKARAKVVRKQIRMLAASLILAIVIVLFIAGALQSKASSNTEVQSYKYYKNVMLSYDLTMEDVANEYIDEHYDNMKDYLDEVCEINHFHRTGNVIEEATSGTHIVVPYYSSEFH